MKPPNFNLAEPGITDAEIAMAVEFLSQAARFAKDAQAQGAQPTAAYHAGLVMAAAALQTSTNTVMVARVTYAITFMPERVAKGFSPSAREMWENRN